MQGLAQLLATAVGWWLGIQAIRAFFVVIVWNVAEDLPATQIAMVGAGFWIAGLAGWLPARVLGRNRSALILAALVAALSVARQLTQHEGALAILAVAALVAWLWWLPAWVDAMARRGASAAIAPGVLLGTAFQLAGQIALDGLDVHALPGAPGALPVAAAGGLLVVAARRLGPVGGSAAGAWGAAALMPWLFLQASLLVNLGRWQALSGWEIGGAGLLAASGLLLGALAVAGWGRVRTASLGLPLVAVLSVASPILIAAGSSGGTATVLLIGGQAVLSLLLHVGLLGGGPAGQGAAASPTRAWRASYLGALLFFVLLFALYYDALDSFGAPVWGLAALIVGLPALLAARRARAQQRLPAVATAARPAAALLALVLVAAAMVGALPAGPEAAGSFPAPARISVLDYNIHQGIARSGVPNLERTLDVIRSADPDVVTLQEVPRIWDLSGAVDTYAWLRAHLPGYHAVFGPSSMIRFGNAIFSRYPVNAWGYEWFPFGPSQDQRGFVWAEIQTDVGPLLVVTMHMTPYNRADEILERTTQAELLVDFWSERGKGIAVLSGDYNSEKEDAAYGRMVDAGLVDALAAVGAGDQPTFRSTGTPFLAPSVEQLDYVFLSPGIRVESGEILLSDASDHEPLLVRLELGGDAPG